MSKAIKEMNLPVISVPPLAVAPLAQANPSPEPVAQDAAAYSDEKVPADDRTDDSVMTIGSPYKMHDPSCVNVYAESITPADPYGAGEPSAIAVFDVVFVVGVNEGTCTKTYRVVKRIGIDRCKIACEAECSAPVSIVEEKSEQRKAEAKETAKRFRKLAGLE